MGARGPQRRVQCHVLSLCNKHVLKIKIYDIASLLACQDTNLKPINMIAQLETDLTFVLLFPVFTKYQTSGGRREVQ